MTARQAAGTLEELRRLVERYVNAEQRFESVLLDTWEKHTDPEASMSGDYDEELHALLRDLQGSRLAITDWLAANRVTRIPRDLATTVKRIRGGHSDSTGHFVDWLLPANALESQDAEELLAKYFVGNFLPGRDPVHALLDAVRRRSRVGGLVVGQGVPLHVERHLDTLRSCFALARFDAAVVFARSLLETAAYAALERRGWVSKGGHVRPIEEYNLVSLLNSVARHCRDLPRSVLDGAHAVRDRARQILHAKNTQPPLAEDEAFALVEKTFRFVEALYE